MLVQDVRELHFIDPLGFVRAFKRPKHICIDTLLIFTALYSVALNVV